MPTTPEPTQTEQQGVPEGDGVDGREIIQDLAQQLAETSIELATQRAVIRKLNKQVAGLQEALVEKSASA